MKDRPRKSHMVIGVVSCLFILFIGTTLSTELLESYGEGAGWFIQSFDIYYKLGSSTLFLVLDLIFSGIIVIFSGYIAALIARKNELKTGMVSGVFALIFFILVAPYYFYKFPFFYVALTFLIIIFGPVVGAKVRLRQVT